jgi:type IV secretory pathway VirB10-like protein
LASKPLGVVGLALVAVMAVWWWSAQGVTGNAQALASSPPLSQAQAPALTAVPAGTAAALSAASARPPAAHVVAAPTPRSAAEKAASEKARAKRQAAAQARREQAAQERAATEERARAAIAVEQQQADEAARAKAAAEGAQRAMVANTGQPPPTPVVKTVDQTCASSGNFFSREACRLRSCGNAALVSDPVCVRLREMEAANSRAMVN